MHIFSPDHDTPLLKDLCNHITPQYAAQWREMGILLGLSWISLNIIEHDNPHDARRCCNTMLEKWLKEDTTASWEKLLTVINSPAMSGSASDKGDYVFIVNVQ